jgi:hydrogenase nickel incorporation protein HypA/HybF
MHELSLIRSVLNLILERSVTDHFERVNRVCLGVGELSNVEVEALVFCFGVAKRGSLAHDAALDVKSIPGKAWCQRCQNNVHLAARSDACPSCGGWGLSVTGGDQITVIEMEVE